ncbi:MAG: hypothetical protein AB2604_01835 [Candidatus Thiodiazotropha taylori]
MAWYLNEVVTDLSPIREILQLYDQTGSFPEPTFHDEYRSRLVALLRETDCNTHHIETDSIPTAYDYDQYRWLAAGYHDLVAKLGLVGLSVDESSRGHAFGLTDIGAQVLNGGVSIPELMRLRLPKWKNDRGFCPYTGIIDILSKLKQRDLYPCGGLLLLEVLLVLKWLNEPYGHIHTYQWVIKQRRSYYPHMAGEPRIDLLQYSDFLWDQLEQDLSNYFLASYPARATLHLMMYAGELSFGPVPDEIFGLVQYITINT